MTRTWFITGASSGLGLALADHVLGLGDRVAATSRRTGPLDELAQRHGAERVWRRSLDVTDTSALHATVADARAELGRLDVVVAAAGQGALGAVEEQSSELIGRQIAVNLVGTIELVRAAVPILRADGSGRIVVLSSSGGQVADPGMSIYNATKFGLEGFVDSVAMELAPFDIELTLIAPGGARTPFNTNLAVGTPHPAYQDGIVGQIRAMQDADPAVLAQYITGDPERIAAAIADTIDLSPAPRRVVLGRIAYEAVQQTLRERLEALAAQRDLALSTDFPS